MKSISERIDDLIMQTNDILINFSQEELFKLLDNLKALKKDLLPESNFNIIPFYISFGPDHVHTINKILVNSSIIIKIFAEDIYKASEIAHYYFDSNYSKVSGYEPRGKYIKEIVELKHGL